MDRFLADQNVALYRRLRSSGTNETERRIVFNLLAKVIADFKMSQRQQDNGKSVKRQSKLVRT